MGPILLTGGSGFLAWSFLAEGRCLPFVLPLRKQRPELEKIGSCEQVELTDFDALKKILIKHQPRAIINTAAVADPRICEEDPRQSLPINVELPKLLATWCAKTNVPMMHFSTDLVFNGRSAPYDESAKPDPLSAYGRQKQLSEIAVLEAYPQAWVIRLPLLYGESGVWTRNGMAQQWDQLQQGQLLTLFRDEYRTPARTRRIARFVLDHLHDYSGLMHLGGPEKLSRLQMGEALCRVFGGNVQQLKSLRQADLNLGTERPADVSLKSDLAYRSGYVHGSFEQELQNILDGGGWHRG